MKRLFLLCFVIVFVAVFLSASAPDSKFIELGSDVYSDMDTIYALSGNGTPSNARPWSVSETRMILARIDRSALPGPAQKLYDNIQGEIETPVRWAMGDDFAIGLGLQVNPEIYTHTNTTDFIQESDWIYDFEKRRHILEADIEMDVDSFFYTYCDLVYGYGKYGQSDEDEGHFIHIYNYPALSLPGADRDMVGTIPIGTETGYIATSSSFYTRAFLFNLCRTLDFDFQWPKRAIFSFAGAKWTASVSRDRINWGNSHIGNLVIDNHVDYHDFLRIQTFTDRFKYDFLAISIDCDPNNQERQAEQYKILFAHRLEFRFLPNLTFAVSENVMFQNDVLLLDLLNPATIYHNLNNRGMLNAIAHAELDYEVFRGTSLYFQFALDQATAPNEGSDQKGAWGVLGGIEHTRAFKSSILTSSLELAYTTPLMYRRDVVDFLMLRKTFSQGGISYASSFDYIGFPYGGDAIVLDLSNSLNIVDVATIGLDLRGLLHGEMNIFQSHNQNGDNTGYPDRKTGSTPSGNRTLQQFSASLSASGLIFRGWPEVKAWGEADFIYRQTYVKDTKAIEDKAFDFQFSMGFGITL